MEIFSTYGKIKMIDVPVERMHPHLSKGYAYVEFENPGEAEKAPKHMDGGHMDGQEITATAVLAPWPRPPRPHPPAIQPSQENAATASHVAQVTPTDEEKVAFPSAQVPRPPQPQEPLQFQLLLISRATEALHCDLHPIQLTFVTFLAEGGSVGKKSLTQGQALKVKAVTATFPLAAEFRLQECCCFGVVLIKMPSSFLVGSLPHFSLLRVSLVAKPAGISRGLQKVVQPQPGSMFSHSTDDLGLIRWPARALTCWPAGSHRKGCALMQLPFL